MNIWVYRSNHPLHYIQKVPPSYPLKHFQYKDVYKFSDRHTSTELMKKSIYQICLLE